MEKSLLIITLILIADQVLKFGIKTNMTLGEEINILGNWFIIHFTENEGMAFGLSFGGIFGKLALSLFRIAAITIIFFLSPRNYPQKNIIKRWSSAYHLFWQELSAICSTAHFTVWSLATHHILQLQSFFLRKAVMAPSSTEKWLICFTSLLFKASTLHGYL